MKLPVSSYSLLIALALSSSTGTARSPAVLSTASCSEHFDWGTLRCGDSPTATLPTPTYGFANRAWMICAEITISAPPAFVYSTLLDFQRYHLWNSFVVDVSGIPGNVSSTPGDVYVGMPMSFTVVGVSNDDSSVLGTSQEVVTVLQDTPRGANRYLMNAWRADVYFDGRLVVAEHPNILTPVETEGGAEGTRIVSYETYYEGDTSEIVRPLQGVLRELFKKQAVELKGFAEKEWDGQEVFAKS